MFYKQKGISQIFILVVMLVLAIALPISLKLVQQNQENRSKAATPSCDSVDSIGNNYCNGGIYTVCNTNRFGPGNYSWFTTVCNIESETCVPDKGCVSNNSGSTKTSCTGQSGSCGLNAATCTTGEGGTIISGTDCVGSVCCKVPVSGSTSCDEKYPGSICVTTGNCASGYTPMGTTSACTCCKETTPTANTCTSNGGECIALGTCTNTVGTVIYGTTDCPATCCKKTTSDTCASKWSGSTCVTGNCASGYTLKGTATECYGGSGSCCVKKTASPVSSSDTCGDTSTKGGSCYTYSSSLDRGAACKVGGNGLAGVVVGNKCMSSSNLNYRCCVPKVQCNAAKDGYLTYKYTLSSNSGTFTETKCTSGQTCSEIGTSAVCGVGTTVTTTTCTGSDGTVHQSGGPNFCEGNVLKGCANGQINTVVDCATSSQVCSNGTCMTTAPSSPKLSFRISFAGVTPTATCLDKFKTVSVTVGKVGVDVKQDLAVDVSAVSGLVSKDGYQVFGANNVVLDSSLAGTNNIYVKIKGQLHAKMYYCKTDQSSKNLGQVCDIALDGTVENFYDYPILAGDVDQNGAINTTDFSLVKNNLFKTDCGNIGDLDGNGIVNNFDIKLIKDSLSYRDDE